MNTQAAYKARMTEQACQIQQYKEMQEMQGRHISIDEAAMEWISLYADKFPPIDTFFSAPSSHSI